MGKAAAAGCRGCSGCGSCGCCGCASHLHAHACLLGCLQELCVAHASTHTHGVLDVVSRQHLRAAPAHTATLLAGAADATGQANCSIVASIMGRRMHTCAFRLRLLLPLDDQPLSQTSAPVGGSVLPTRSLAATT